jgi:glycosyltransferase involved in cell wall biosynthesis
VTRVRVAAVVPAYDAAASVGDVVRGLLASGPFSWEGPAVIVVDDGSSDLTSEIATREGALVIRHDRNRGKGFALRTGLRRALELGATLAVTVDADGQHPPPEAAMLALHDADPEALVLGVRDLVREGAPRPNQISNRISNFFLSYFTGRSLRDTQCGLRRYPVASTLALGAVDDGYAFEAECVLRAARAGWSIAEVPVRVYYPPEEARVTHFHSARDPAKIVYRVLATLASTRTSRGGTR